MPVRRVLLDSRDRDRPSDTTAFDFTVSLNSEYGSGALKNVTAVDLKALVFPKIAGEHTVYLCLELNNDQDHDVDVTDNAVQRVFATGFFDTDQATGSYSPLKGADFCTTTRPLPATVAKLGRIRCTFRTHGGAIVTWNDTESMEHVVVLLEVTCDDTLPRDTLGGGATATSVYPPDPPGPVLVLDALDAAPAAAYSVSRKLSDSYTGPAFLLRNGAGVVTNIGFLADGSVDEAAMLAHCGTAGSGFVDLVYDQTNNGRHAFQTGTFGALTSPAIVVGGQVLKTNGRVAVRFDGTNDHLLINDFAYNRGSLSVSCVMNPEITNRAMAFLSHQAVAGTAQRSWYLTNSLGPLTGADGATVFRYRLFANQPVGSWIRISEAPMRTGLQHYGFSYVNQTLQMLLDGQTLVVIPGQSTTPVTPTDLTDSSHFIGVGCNFQQPTAIDNTTTFRGTMCEWYIFDAPFTRAVLDADVTAFFGL